MPLPWSALWQLVHDTVKELKGDLSLVDTIVDKHMPDLVMLHVNKEEFVESVKSLLVKYRK